MALVPLIEYDAAPPAVRAVYDDIMATRKVDWVNNFWKALANDPSTLERTIQEKQSELKQADAEIEQTAAQARIAREQNATAVMKAGYDIERAKLDASKGADFDREFLTLMKRRPRQTCRRSATSGRKPCSISVAPNRDSRISSCGRRHRAW